MNMIMCHLMLLISSVTMFIMMSSDDQSLINIVDEEQFSHNLALFYLKLQAKCLLPTSAIQNI